MIYTSVGSYNKPNVTYDNTPIPLLHPVPYHMSLVIMTQISHS